MEDDKLKKEIRCGFEVSEKRKRIWNVELDLLNRLDGLCKKHGLRYYASNGTLLGTIRHKGFIPWDDDRDVMMPRDDYEKLIRIAGKELKAPYVLHTPDSDGRYYRNYLRIRNENTTAICRPDFGRDICHGIFVDIFPIDVCPDSRLLWMVQFAHLFSLFTFIMMRTYDYKNRGGIVEAIKGFVTKLSCIIHPGNSGYEKLMKKHDRWRRRYNKSSSKNYYEITHKKNAYIYKREWLDDFIMMPFEDMEIPVPKGYDEILKSLYGDYMKLPSMEERGVHHNIFFDPDKPYTEYQGKITRDEAIRNENNY